ESGNIKLEYIPFELRGLLNSCNSIILPRAMEKNISLQFYAESIIDKQLIGDPTRLRQVLLNLLSNAVKFTDSGFVKLSVIQKYETEDSIILRFEIKDSGIGMTSDQISIIFEPFMQADVSTTRKYGGTGLGLSITKNLLELMGGQLDINTQPGIGTAIAFELKFAIADSSENPSAEIYSEEKFSGEKHSTKKHSAGKPKSKIVETADIAREIKKPLFDGEILVCEDNLVNQRVITEHLARVGLKTELAENGQEGIEKVRLRKEKGLKPFDLILMDIHMPVMDGIEATPKILELGTGTPIVAMTANVMSDDKELYKKAGIVDYVGKPFTSQELWRCLLRFLKPVDLAKVSDPKTANTENGDGSANLQKELETLFTKSHKNVCDEIKSAIAAGDIKTAHRLAHTIKSSAAQIGRTALSKAAAELEAALKDDKNQATETQMNALQYELSETLGTITQYPDEPKNQAPDEPSAIYDEVKARELIEKLESLLQTGNAECLTMIGELRAIPGSGEVIRQMEDFYFTAAEKALAELKTNLNL
ncbi:MAG: ATP-binding protein, partial [Treponema sp.]|nr:ATP-binding protein [Treponema sp.]